MRARRIISTALVAIACAIAIAEAQNAPFESDQDVLIELERGWNEAFYHKDVEFIRNLLADEFVATYDDGSRGDKAHELKLVVEVNQNIESAVQDEFSIKVYRDTAVVWFVLRVMGVTQGQKTELALRYTDVWIIRDGRWQCVSSQSTRTSSK